MLSCEPKKLKPKICHTRYWVYRRLCFHTVTNSQITRHLQVFSDDMCLELNGTLIRFNKLPRATKSNGAEEEVLLEARVNDHVRTVAHWQSRVGLVVAFILAPLMPGKPPPGGFCRVSRCLLYRVSLDFFFKLHSTTQTLTTHAHSHLRMHARKLYPYEHL